MTPITAIAFGPNGVVASCDDEGNVLISRIRDGGGIRELKLPARPVSCEFDPSGKHLAVGLENGTINIIELSRRENLHLVILRSPCKKRIHSLSYSPDGQFLASGGEKTCPVIVWKTDQWKIVTKHSLGASISAIKFFPDSTHLVIGSSDGIGLLEIKTDNFARIKEFGLGGSYISVSKNGILMSADCGSLTLCDMAKMKTIKYIAPDIYITTAVISPEGRNVALGSFILEERGGVLAVPPPIGVVVIINCRGEKLLRFFFDSTVNALSFSPDGTYLAVGGNGGELGIFKALRGKLISRFEHDANVKEVEIYRDGKFLATIDQYDTVYLWDITTGKRLKNSSVGGLIFPG